ncbi:MAG TPA: hypothetical protein VEY68_03330 [Anoxybacillus sp.]|jgi:hypothetical protein|nr:hypothetical protein [Anoxybacillus sp.]
MTHEIRKAKIKCEFTNGFSLSPDTSTEEALQKILDAVKNGDTAEVKIVAEYTDGTEADFEFAAEEADEEDDEED